MLLNLNGSQRVQLLYSTLRNLGHIHDREIHEDPFNRQSLFYECYENTDVTREMLEFYGNWSSESS